ncbi:MAG: T9SS type A sorting domain-containing protein, partial [Gammaproteobacteria bacterium]|nr:T9SS type A sorting domain-containing protein [Gammaproteobacteria bacterium]
MIAKNDLVLNMANDEELEFASYQLGALYDQSQYNQDGWAVIRYGINLDPASEIIFRSELPANQDSLNYWTTMNTIFSEQSEIIGIAHIRTATSGASLIPNPHPWLFQDSKTYSFVHNGGASKELLYDLITNNGSDESWLEQHPPQTFGNGDWRDNGWNSVVDSELIMLLIMKQINIFDDVLVGLESAFSMMLEGGISPYMLNSVFSDSESLYVYGGSNGLQFSESESFYSVMSSPPNNSSTSYNWEPISSGELIVLKKDGMTRYPSLAVLQSNEPEIIPPLQAQLYPAYPNPFNGQVVIPFRVPSNRNSLISIFNVSGHNVYSKYLSFSEKESGNITWQPDKDTKHSLTSGVYIIKM